MPRFVYEAVDARGRRYREKIEAADITEVLSKLRSLGLIVLDIKPEEGTAAVPTPGGKRAIDWKKFLNLEIQIGSGVGAKDLSILARQLAALIEAGVGVVDALELVADSIDNKTLKKLLPQIAEEVRSGTSLYQAFEKRKKIFGEFFISMIEIGEETGQLDSVLKKIADYFETISEIINKIKSASFYPTFVFIAASTITFAIIYFLVPTFAQIYHSLGGQLPAPTQMLINISHWLQKNILYFLGGIFVFAIIFFVLYKYLYQFKKLVHFIQLRLPILGGLFIKGAIANLSRTFATLFSAGVPVERALELSAKVMENVIYKEAIERVRDDVMKGEPIWRAFEKTKRFPKMFIAMIKIGEETGQLDNMLESLARFYEDEVKATIDAIISLIEPMMIVVIGTVVGGILLSLYLPIFRLGELIHS